MGGTEPPPLLSGEDEDTESDREGGCPIPVALVVDVHEAAAFGLQHVEPVEVDRWQAGNQ